MKLKYKVLNKLIKYNTEINLIYISFKLHNIFINLNIFIKYFEFFVFNKIVKTYSCGSKNFKNKNKLSIESYSNMCFNLIVFLLNNKYNTIHLLFKGHKKFKYSFLHIFLTITYECDTIKILSIYNIVSFPYNGCRLKKRKFL